MPVPAVEKLGEQLHRYFRGKPNHFTLLNLQCNCAEIFLKLTLNVSPNRTLNRICLLNCTPALPVRPDRPGASRGHGAADGLQVIRGYEHSHLAVGGAGGVGRGWAQRPPRRAEGVDQPIGCAARDGVE